MGTKLPLGVRVSALAIALALLWALLAGLFTSLSPNIVAAIGVAIFWAVAFVGAVPWLPREGRLFRTIGSTSAYDGPRQGRS